MIVEFCIVVFVIRKDLNMVSGGGVGIRVEEEVKVRRERWVFLRR